MRLKLLHRTALYAGALSLLVCTLVGIIGVIAFEWQERAVFQATLQAGIDEMHAHIAAGGWPGSSNSAVVVSAVGARGDLRAVPEALRTLALGQHEIASGSYAEFEILVREIDGYRYYYGVSNAAFEHDEARFFWLAIFVGLSAVALSAGLGWLFARKLVRPMRAVAEAISRIDGPMPSPALLAQNQDEIDQIVAAINRYRAQLARAAEHETAFLADVAHALRTPIAVIQSGLEIVQTGAGVIDKKVFERIQRNSLQLGVQLDALMLSARKPDASARENLMLAREVEDAMRYIGARDSTSFVISVDRAASVPARSAVLRWIIIQCANALREHAVVDIQFQANALLFIGSDLDTSLAEQATRKTLAEQATRKTLAEQTTRKTLAEQSTRKTSAVQLPELSCAVCAREGWRIECLGAQIRLSFG